ncbi:Lymphocyte antigen 6 complex locus protein G6f [Cricetulus griseus]|uniref:Lymphocyte antigen 6 complex locus protein G6f n=1 Tax=Cricetulus griseus TaxID=10029 RepID=G3HZG0_CRIGR|nr:Lymphocyte antigen 6 complex locus protein G6f [Cricetulus griseus]ERE88828.1 lymphocyte antigen 6 complex locus protein G6f-like protein [Cricetulus griseus]
MAVIVALHLLLFWCGCPRAAADSIQIIYAISGESAELPCPSPPSLLGGQLLSWFRSPAGGSSTILVAQIQVDRPVSDLGKPENDSRFKVLGNYSLLLEGPRDEDAGRYWCTVMDQNRKYQNWRVYDVSVLKAPTEPSPTTCAPVQSWDVPRVLILLFTAGQGVTIIVLSIVLCRRRAQASRDREPSIPHFKPEVQVYENIHLARLGPPTHKTR